MTKATPTGRGLVKAVGKPCTGKIPHRAPNSKFPAGHDGQSLAAVLCGPWLQDVCTEARETAQTAANAQKAGPGRTIAPEIDFDLADLQERMAARFGTPALVAYRIGQRFARLLWQNDRAAIRGFVAGLREVSQEGAP